VAKSPRCLYCLHLGTLEVHGLDLCLSSRADNSSCQSRRETSVRVGRKRWYPGNSHFSLPAECGFFVLVTFLRGGPGAERRGALCNYRHFQSQCKTVRFQITSDAWVYAAGFRFQTTYINIYWGAGIAPVLWSNGRRFESLQERRENFLLRGQLSVLTLISVSVRLTCFRSST